MTVRKDSSRLIILGDVNVKIEKENHNRHVAEKHTVHNITTDNGIRLCNLSVGMNIHIVGIKYNRMMKTK